MNRIVVVAALACLLHSSPALAVGGMYVDNVLLTNNGASVFADSFDRGTLEGWKAAGASLIQSQPNPPQYSLYLNKSQRGRSQAEHVVSLDSVGRLELSAWLYLPPVEQQSNYAGSRCDYAGFVIYAADPQDYLTTSLYLQPKGTGYRAQAQWRDAVRKNTLVKSYTGKPVINGDTWVRATMRLDPEEKTVSLLLDNKLACRISYEPERFKSISSILLFSDLGG